MELKDRLKASRTKAKLTQKEVASSISGLTQPSYSELERGESKSTSKIAELSELFNVSSIWLATGKGDINSEITFVVESSDLLDEDVQNWLSEQNKETKTHINDLIRNVMRVQRIAVS